MTGTGEYRGAVVLVVLAFWCHPSLAWEQKQSSQGFPVHWKNTCLDIYLHQEGSDDMPIEDVETALIASLDSWNSVESSSLTLRYAGRTNQEELGPKLEDPVIIKVVFRDKYWPYTDFEVAYTKPHWYSDTGELYDADIELDGEGVSFTLDPVAEPYKMDLQSVITHELGHVLGFLENWDDPEATMYGELFPGETDKRTLNEDDVEGLTAVYPKVEGNVCEPIEPGFLDVTVPEGKGGGCSTPLSHHATNPLYVMAVFLLFFKLLFPPRYMKHTMRRD